MIPNINQKQMQSMMKQMGINQIEIPSSKVIIKKEDGGQIIIDNPSVIKIKMGGQESFQITGDVSEESDKGFSQEDIEIVMQKTNCTKQEAEEALEKTGNLAEAILELS